MNGETVSVMVLLHLLQKLTERVDTAEASIELQRKTIALLAERVGLIERTLSEHDMSTDEQLELEAAARAEELEHSMDRARGERG